MGGGANKCPCCKKTHTQYLGLWCKNCKGTAAWDKLSAAKRDHHHAMVAKKKARNKKTNGKAQEEKRKIRAAYQAKHLGIPTASDAKVDEYVAETIKTVDNFMAIHRQKNPNASGFALGIYLISTGGGLMTAKREGQLQFATRGRLASGEKPIPPIRILESPAPHVVPQDDMDAHAGPGVPVFNAEDDKVAAVAIEKALHRHYIPILKKSRTDVPLQIRFGGGTAQGMGPYVVAYRAIPLPLPAGWSIRTVPWVSRAHALATDVCQGGTVKGGGQPNSPAAARGGSHSGKSDLRDFFPSVKQSTPNPSKKRRF